MIRQARTFSPRVPVVLWTSFDVSRTIVEIDPDVVLSQSDGMDELLRIIGILRGEAAKKEEM